MVVRFDRTHLSPAESRRLGRHLAEVRQAAGLSLGSLARWLKLPETTLGAYEAGRARFPVRLIFAAARALDVTPYHLLAGRSDRVLNPWEPRVEEWRRARRWGGLPSQGPPGERGPEKELAEDGEAGLAADEPDDGAGGPFEPLTGEEARRALEFLDEPGPARRFEEKEDEAW